MSTIVSTVLITAPPAFLTGWILSKVLFRHLSLTRPNVTREGSVMSPEGAAAAAGHSGDGGQVSANATANGLTDSRRFNILRQKLAVTLAETQSLRSEIQLLKEAAAEREHKLLELKRKLQVQLMVPEESLSASPAKQKQFVQMLEDRLSTYEHRIEELEHELAVTDSRAKRTAGRFRKWRLKFKPMARQFRQQRTIISELREELRRRDLEQQKLAEAQSRVVESALSRAAGTGTLQATTPAAARTPDATVAADSSSATTSGPASQSRGNEREDLQALRGVGPALHKKLNEKGVYRLRQLAVMSPQALIKLGKSLGVSKKLLTRHDWAKQARTILNMPELCADEKIEA